MNPRRYSFYNAVGALLWGSGLTFAGYLLGHIPPVADFVTKYIEFILLGAVAIGVVPTVYHYIRSVLKARKARAAGVENTEDLSLDPALFDQKKTNNPPNS